MNDGNDSMPMSSSSSRSAKSQSAASAEAPTLQTRLLSIPLVPHHVHKRRRLLEIMTASTAARYSKINHTSPSDLLWGYEREIRPRTYPRRQQQRRRRRRRRLSTTTTEDNVALDPTMSEHDATATLAQQEQQQQQHQRNFQVLSLYQGFGTHYADVWVGSPPQRQTLIVDTGSATTAFACSGCSPRRCGRLERYHTDPLFREAHSRTFQKVNCSDCFLGECVEERDECSFGVAYQEGSNWTAYEAVDRCYVGGLHTRALSPDHSWNVSGTSMANGDATAGDGLDPHRAALDYSFDLRFGCQTQMTGPFRTQLADGIMGRSFRDQCS
jgi:Xylanase inhibitor N-terminal